MGRPTKSRVVTIDSDILAVARELFLEGGYANTSMEAVAAKAAISKSTLYARYPGKAELFRSIVADRLSVWVPASVDACPTENVRDLLHMRGGGFFAAMRQPEIAAFDRLILREAIHFPEIAEEFHRQGYLSGISELADDIRRCAANGAWVVDAAGVARVFTAALLGWWRSESLRGEVQLSDADAFLDRLIEIMIGGKSIW